MEEGRVAQGGRGHRLFHGESRVVEQWSVRVNASAVRVEDDDGLRYGVDDAPQFLIGGLEFRGRLNLNIEFLPRLSRLQHPPR